MKKLFIAAISTVMVATSCNDSGGGEEKAATPDFELRIMSMNTRHLTNKSEESTAEQDGALFRALEPDVVSLQELDSCNTRSAEFQIDKLAKLSEMTGEFCKTIDYGGGAYGIGMLYSKSYEPLSRMELALYGEEARKAICIEFEDFAFIATHFCHKNPDNRTRSFEALASFIRKNYDCVNKPVFLAGDLNSDIFLEEAFKNALQKDWISLSDIKTPTFHGSISACIDYILLFRDYKGKVDVTSKRLPEVEGINTGNLSDHYPIMVDIEIRKPR